MQRVRFKLSEAIFFELPTRRRENARDIAWRIFRATKGRPFGEPVREGGWRIYTHDMDDPATDCAENLLDLHVPSSAVELIEEKAA